MSLSQTRCLEDGHVNPRTHESKVDFFYCEDQRLALEALLRDGRDAFHQFLRGRDVRGFLSEPEQETLIRAAERYDPGSELLQAGEAEDEEHLSLRYWPDVSDVTAPHMDLGWPDCAAYRGVTRVHVYAQPPLDGQAHIKEIVRKTIAHAQKVIAVVMDVFTDVDIFRDLLDASFKRKVSVYILLERTALTHFLSMCERANMHKGHLKNLRVRCMGGAEFYTRSCTRVRGHLGHRFIFVDGDKAVSGSYSFTWMSSRLDKHLITVVTGQTVDTYDRVFRDLYVMSSAVSLQQVAMEPEPKPEPLPPPAPLALPPADVARKLYNPKYALLGIGTTKSPSPTSSSGHNSPKDSNSQNPPLPQSGKMRSRVNKEATVEGAPPLHPGLANLERAYLIPYLPTWPEPDPPSDVIGFINIRDASRPTQVHLQRSERFEISQAIRFRSPISMPEEVLPEVAQPQQTTTSKEVSTRCNVKSTPGDTKLGETMLEKTKPGQLDAGPSSTGPEKTEQGEHRTGPKPHTAHLKLVNTETPPQTLKSESRIMTMEEPDTPAVIPTIFSIPTSQNTGQTPTPGVDARTSLSNTTSILHLMPVKATHPAHTNNPSAQPLPLSKIDPPGQATPGINTGLSERSPPRVKASDPRQTHKPASSHGAHSTNLLNPVETGAHTETESAQVRCAQPGSLKITKTPRVHNQAASASVSPAAPVSVSSVSDSDGATVPVNKTPSVPPVGCTHSPLSSSSIVPPSLPLLLSSSKTPDTAVRSVPTSSICTHPVPKPRTIQLVIKPDGSVGDPGTDEVSVVPRGRSHLSMAIVMERTASVTETRLGTDPELAQRNKSGMKDRDWGEPRDDRLATKHSGAETEKHGTSGTAQERDCWSRKGAQVLPGAETEAQPDIVLISTTQRDMKPKDIHTTPQVDNGSKSPLQAEASAAPNDNSENETRSKSAPQKAGPSPPISLTSRTNRPGSVSDVHTHGPISANRIHEPGVDGDLLESGPARAESALPTHPQQGIVTCSTNGRTTETPQSGPNTAHESQQQAKANGSSHTPKRDPRSHLSDWASVAPEVPSVAPDRDGPSHSLLCRTPTPDSRTNTADPRSHTPDFRTPTPDVSDGYLSPRDDSTLSTTSEEYYECCESPLYEHALDRSVGRGQRTTENCPSTQPGSGSWRASARPPSSVSSTADSSDSSGSSLTSSPPLNRERVRNDGCQKNRREECEGNTGSSDTHSSSSIANTVIAVSTPTPRNTSLPAATLSEPADTNITSVPVFRDGTKPEGAGREQSCHGVQMPPVGPMEFCLMEEVQETSWESFSKTELTGKGSELKGLSTDECETSRFSTEDRKREDFTSRDKTLNCFLTRVERAAGTPALGPSRSEKRGWPGAFTEMEVKKAVQAGPRRPPRRVDLQNPQTPPSRPSRPHPAPQPAGGINQAGTKLIHRLQALESERLPRPALASGAAGVDAAGPRSQGDSAPRRHSSPYSPPPADQGKGRVGQSWGQPAHTQGSILHTQPNVQTPRLSTLNPAARQGSALGSSTTAGAAEHERSKPSSSLSVGRLHNVKSQKERVSKPSPQSKRSRTSSPTQGDKS